MIRTREATMLALTKLRTRKVRLAVTVIISGLLFGGLAGLSMISQGLFGSIDRFGKEGFSDRYIISAYPNNYASNNEWVLNRADAIFKETTARKKAEAKRLGIEYSAGDDQGPVKEGGGQKYLEYNHPAARQAQAEYEKEHPVGTLDQLKTAAAPFSPIAFYQIRNMASDRDNASLIVLKDGREDIGATPEKDRYGAPIGTDSFLSMWSLVDGELMKPFTLPQQDLKTGEDGSIPVVVPLKAAEQLGNVSPLAADASSRQKLEHTKEVRRAVAGTRFQVCYRNQTSAELLRQAHAMQEEIAAHKNKKEYRQPDLVYGVPAKACEPVPVIRDVRINQEKTADGKQLAFDQAFGKELPAQEILLFRVVGVVPDAELDRSAIESLTGSILNSSLGAGWFVPTDQIEQKLVIKKLFTDPTSFQNNLVEFASADMARAFMKKEQCSFDPDYRPGVNPAQACIDAGKYFSLSAYGSNSLAIEEVRAGFNRVLSIAALVVAGIAALIMMGTVGKMIADGRRETAVFRAIGAKKLDIAQIYVLYVTCISLLILLFALVLGFVISLIADAKWSESLTYQALLAYNVQDLDKTLHLYGLHLPHMLTLTGVVLGVGLLSASIPLIRSLRRNPIRDMRDDT